MTKLFSKSIIVKGDVNNVYEAWANFENFPNFMKSIKSVTITGDKTSHWVVEGPGGMLLDWNAEMTRQEVNKRIAWNSKDKKGMLTTSGQVTFNSLPDRSTEVTVTMQIAPPGGKVGEAVATYLTQPEQKLTEDLRNFKEYMEKG